MLDRSHMNASVNQASTVYVQQPHMTYKYTQAPLGQIASQLNSGYF